MCECHAANVVCRIRVKYTPLRQDQVFEWRFVTHMLSVHIFKSICLYVGALLGVWGIIPFFWCLTIMSADTVCVLVGCGWGVV